MVNSIDMSRVKVFESHRDVLFGIAYRMLGSAMDAEDIVQEAYLRWREVELAAVEAPKSYLSTIVTRLCIDQLRSAKERREVYPGQWLPEPLETKEVSRVIEDVMLAESLSTAFLVLLESLTPVERATFLLRDVFDFEYPQIAEIVGKSESNCRKMTSRARQYIGKRKSRFDASPEERKRLTAKFVSAVQGGDLEGLIDMLAKDAVLYSDGGGKVPSARQPIYGTERIARFLIGLMRKSPPDLTVRLTGVNGMPGIVVFTQGKPLTVFTLEIGTGKVRKIYGVVNPDKLQRFG